MEWTFFRKCGKIITQIRKGDKYMAYKVLDVSRYVINYSNEKEYGISNLKLQKILYFIQAFFLISASKSCFKEKIEAWDFGPVVPEAYREYKQFGGGDIPSISYIIDFNDENIWESDIVEYEDDIISKSDKQRIMAVVDKFADYSATDLVSITHAQTPWKSAYKKGQNNEITIESMKGFFNV